LVNINYLRGNGAEAVRLLQAWLRYHPDDKRARGTLGLIQGVPPDSPPPANVVRPGSPAGR